MKKILITICALISFNTLNAQVNLTTNSYSQDFNTLDTASTPSANLPTGWAILEVGTSGSVDQMYAGNTGASNAGNVYSYGNTSDRALGSLASGSNRPRFGVGFTNNTGSTITSLSYSIKVEQWRLGDISFTSQDSTLIEYSSNASGIPDTLSTWQTNNVILSPVMTGGAAGPLDGNLTTNQYIVTGTINVTVGIGSTLYIRFSDINGPGSDDGLALDDASFTFSNIPVNAPLLVSTIPSDNATNIPFGTSNLSITFDKNITIGTGNVYINNLTAGGTQTIAASSCTAAGMVVTIPGVTLNQTSNYAVQYDSTCFMYLTNNGFGIYNNSSWNFKTADPKPLINTLSPADNSVNVAINPTLSVTFDKPITQGVGLVYIINITDATFSTKAVPSADVVVSGSTATISNLSLLNSKTYAVLYDSACFNAASNNSYGIYDSTTWNFNTIGLPPSPVTSLNESFTSCIFPGVAGFTQYSVDGNPFWRCSNAGHSDTFAVRINGGLPSSDNTDWLVTAPLNLSAMTNPYLHFWTKKKFNGTTTKEVLVSSNYIGIGDPTPATWTNLNKDFSTLADDVWTAYNNTNLTPYKASNFNIGFKYTSTAANNADEWSIDDVIITEGSVNIQSFDDNTLMYVVNNMAQTQLFIKTNKADIFNVEIFDMMGKKVISQNLNVLAGATTYNVQSNALASGMYFMQVSNGAQKIAMKFQK